MATAFTPYRDPRTAYGRPIPIGEATELPGMPLEPPRPAQQPATGIDSQPTRKGAMPRTGLRSLAGPAGVALAAVPEAIDVGKVAANPRATGIDVATQAAEGVGRLGAAGAGAAGGAKLGAMAAPFLGPLAPAGPLVGGIAGGVYGYYAADKAIRGGRELAGVDPRSPVEQIGAAPAPREAGGGRGFVNPPAVDPTQPPPTNAPEVMSSIGPGVSVVGNGDGGESVRGIDARTRAINEQMAATQRGIDAYGPGPQGGGAVGIGGATLSSANRQAFDSTPSLSNLPAPGQSIGQFQALRAAEREGSRQRETTERGQDAQLQAQLAATGAQRGIADLNARTQRDVATIGAQARTTAAETQANARAAGAEAGARRFTVVPGGQEVQEIGGMPTTIKKPDRVFNNATGTFVEQPGQQTGPTATPRAEYDKLPKGARYVGPDGKTYVKG